MSVTDHVLYLYCFASLDFLGEPPLELAGLDERPVTVLARGKVVALVSSVSRDEFAGPQAEAHLSDLAWLGPRALRHEQVVEQVMQRSPVFPARFGTLFSSVESLAQLLARYGDEICAFADRTAGQEEWAVKGYLERRRAAQALVERAEAGQEQLSRSPGLRFLQKQRLQAQAAGRVREWLGEAQERLRRELRRFTGEPLVERPAGGPTPEGLPGELVLNWALLVPRAAAVALRESLEGLDREWAPEGLTLRGTGPFPPYSFTPRLGEPHT